MIRAEVLIVSLINENMHNTAQAITCNKTINNIW